MIGWNGVPGDPERSGWHWINSGGWLEPKFWIAPKPPVTIAGYWLGGSPSDPVPWLTAGVRYMGPCRPPDGR
jgi:hypothetical protein